VPYNRDERHAAAQAQSAARAGGNQVIASSAAPRGSMSDAERKKFRGHGRPSGKERPAHTADQAAVAHALAANGTDLETWFGRFRSPTATFLRAKDPRQRRRRARRAWRVARRPPGERRKLLDKHPGRTAQEVGKTSDYDIAGLRPPKKATGGTLPSFHCFGWPSTSIHDTNPFVGNLVPSKDRRITTNSCRTDRRG